MRTQRDPGAHGVGPVQALAPAMLVALLASACAPVTGRTVSTAAVHAHVSQTFAHPDGGHRWPAGSELRVDVSHLDTYDRSAVFHAFEAWLAPARMPLTVREVESAEDANVVFRSADAGVRFRGRTQLEWDGPWVTGATVEVVLARHGTPVSGAERQRILVHEVGHVLGLAHSQRLSSVMHPDPPGNSVDDTDRAALVFLYGAPTAVDAVLTVAAPAPELR